ncbi:MAG TPA: AI-2E family transporter [Acetobacteraceae bacterium]
MTPAIPDQAAPDAAPAAAAGVSLLMPGRGLAALNAAAIVVAALYFGRDLLVPLALAVLLAFVLAPLVTLLQRARIGKVPAVLVAVTLAFSVILGIGTVIGRQATSLAGGFPAYQAIIQEKVKSLTVGAEVIERFSGSLQSLLSGQAEVPSIPYAAPAPGTATPGTAAPVPSVPMPVPAAEGGTGVASTFGIVRTVAGPVFGPLATMGVVVVFLLFVLLNREDLRDRLVRLVGRQDLHRTILAMNDAARRLSRYFLFQLSLNVSFGLFIGTGLWAIGLPNPVLWGIVAALMRFVPYIGSVIALVLPFLLALAAAPGWSLALMVLGMFILADLLMGQVIEPLLYGHSTGLSPIAVILSTAFWVFLWGPVGLLIATPLTVCLVVAGRYVAPLSFLEVMLSDSPPLTPPETFYQRALEGNAVELAAQAERLTAPPPAGRRARRAKAASPAPSGQGALAEYYDRVALRGLALAQADLSRDALAFERLEAIHVQIERLLSQMARQAGSPPDALPSPAWQAEGAVVCIPARGQLDDLAATMAMQVLQGAGFGARQESNLVLGAGHAAKVDLGKVRLCCLSVLDQGSSPSGLQYLLRRIQRRMPGAVVVVGLWHAAGDSALLAALRAEGSAETIVLSLGELVALARAVSARQPVAAVPA